MGSLLPSLFLLLAPCATPAAQGVLAAELAQRAAELERGSAPWFRLGFERVEAELRSDVRAAHALALGLVEDARASADPDLLATAAALADLTLGTLEGPAHAGDWSPAGATPPAPEAPAWLRARYALARSRVHCQNARIGDELATALEGSAAARASGDLGLRALAALVQWHVTHDSAETLQEDLHAELAELAREPEIGAYRQRLLFVEYDGTLADYTREERLARLSEIETLARACGDRATLGRVAWARAEIAFESGQIEPALHQQALAAQEFERLGDRRDHAFTLENAADLAIGEHQLERARVLLAQATELIEGRGFKEREAGLLRSRFDLAVSEKDSATVLALTDPLEEIEREEDEELRAYVPLRDQLLSAQRLRVEAERALAAERAETAQSRAAARRVLWFGVLLSLGLLSALALRSRQGLLRANRRLAAEMERAEREVAARRALEERMRQLERTESLGLVAGGVAHDFNNLMVGVLGNAELLLLREADPARRELLGSIAGAGQRAARLCRQLQAYTGEGPEAQEPLCLGALVQELAPVLRTAAGEGLEFRCDAERGLVSVVGDRTTLEQAVLNLITNARDAGARQVEVTVKRLLLGPQDLERGHFRGEVRAGEFACLEVRDDGEGMTPELLARIFDPFFTTRFPGRGLGLAVVFGAVRRHQGLIAVESRPGQGSTFRLCLPLAREPIKVLVPRTPLAPSAPLAALDVLAFDDEAPVRAFLAAALEERGHRVRTQADGTGLAAALAGFVDPARAIVLLDLTMPGQDGRDLAHAVRLARPALPIVLMSGHPGPQIAELARELGLRVWLQKPFGIEELEVALARVFEASARAEGSANLSQAGK